MVQMGRERSKTEKKALTNAADEEKHRMGGTEVLRFFLYSFDSLDVRLLRATRMTVKDCCMQERTACSEKSAFKLSATQMKGTNESKVKYFQMSSSLDAIQIEFLSQRLTSSDRTYSINIFYPPQSESVD